MDEDPQVIAAREEALKKIGRNVYVFQRLEKDIKTLLAIRRIDGPPDRWREVFERNAKKVSRLTMGSLVNRLFETLVVEDSGADESPAKDAETWSMAFTVRLEGDGHTEFKEAFDQLVRERNLLVHEDLSSFDLNCLDSCRTLAERLDAQREKLDVMLRFVGTVGETLRESSGEILRLIDSGEFFQVAAPEQGR